MTVAINNKNFPKRIRQGQVFRNKFSGEEVVIRHIIPAGTSRIQFSAEFLTSVGTLHSRPDERSFDFIGRCKHPEFKFLSGRARFCVVCYEHILEAS